MSNTSATLYTFQRIRYVDPSRAGPLHQVELDYAERGPSRRERLLAAAVFVCICVLWGIVLALLLGMH